MNFTDSQIINIIFIAIIAAIVILAAIAVFIILKMRSEKEKKQQEIITDTNKTQKPKVNLITREGKEINSIYKFMEFDSVTNNMIVRQNGQQYVMVIDCRGINYDLLSNDEKYAVEVGFMEFLNTLRFPVQLYVQTRKLDLTDLLKEYDKRTQALVDEINRITTQINLANQKGNKELVDKLIFDRRRKQNILEYGESIEDYTARINESQNMLQQKTYICLSYYTIELGDASKYSKEELNDIVFSELYTRAQTVIRALSSAEITGRVLNSEELAELLYMAYNRDAAQTYTLRTALDAQYDRLYSTSKDILEEREKQIRAQVEDEASRLASKSIIRADELIRREKAEKATKVKQRAKDMVDEYKDQVTPELYDATMKEIDNAKVDTADKLNIDPNKKNSRVTRRK